MLNFPENQQRSLVSSRIIFNIIRMFLFFTILVISTNAVAFGEPWSKSINRSNPEDLSIRLVTFGPGDLIAEKFGHTGIWVVDKKLNYDRLYNFGMFHFDSNLIPQFLQANMQFWVGSENINRAFQFYQSRNRDITADELNIPPEARLKMAQNLAESTLPENKYYRYDHYYDNCSTRVRDAINEASGGILYTYGEQMSPYTLREYTTIYTHSNPIVYFAIMYWMNGDIDTKIDNWDAMFLPAELQRVVQETKYPNGESLVSETESVYQSVYRAPIPPLPTSSWPYFLLTSLILLLATALVALWYTSSFSAVPRILLGFIVFITAGFFGLLAMILTAMQFTQQTVAHYNINMLLANPLTFLLSLSAIGIIFNSRRAFNWSQYGWTFLAGSSIICLVASPFVLQNVSVPLAMLFPMNMGYSLIFWVIEIMRNERELE